MKKWLQRFIEKLAKSNSETFKGQPLDCCSLNKKPTVNTKKNN